jgi:pimeloyl-ACP methyl ester carboxylesterase
MEDEGGVDRAPGKDRRLTLPGGRGLCYAEFGASNGIPVVYCHGFPGSRLEAAFADRIASTLGARLIAVDRPGMGMSDYRAERTILGWADDVLFLVDHL